MRRFAAVTVFACLMGIGSQAALAGALISDDFQSGTGAWSSTSWTRVDVGGGQYMYQGASGTATNPTKLPAAMQLDFDVQRTSASVGSGPRIHFHCRTSGSLTASKGYWLRYLDDYNTDKDGLQLWDKAADYGPETMIGFAAVPLDLNVHHVRLIDDGAGHFRIYFDNMTTPAMVVDDSASYLGADDTYIGLSYTGRVDNITVSGDDAPDAVTDLAAGNPDWFKLDLTWTAPTDYPIGPAAAYDIRYSTDPISEANWASATSCGCEPGPAQPGQPQITTVRNLLPGTTYYFALKSADAGGKISAISNIASGTTSPLDVVAPSAIEDLSFSNVRANRVTLAWTATGDDGSTGVADRYDVRYSTTPISETSWAAATQATGMPTPEVSGSAETFTLTGLAPETTYYVAVMVGDEVPNWSPISNSVTFSTPQADLVAPATIDDLRLTGTHIHAAFLTWTAPSDVGGAGIGDYDLRYSTSPIDDSNFAVATPVLGMPSPGEPGTMERITVSSLDPDTVYYFAIRTSDQAEPANISGLSNVVTGRTMPPVSAVTVRNPWITNDRVADCRTVLTMAATFDKAYTPDGVTTPDPADIETRAINSYNNFKRRCYHWGQELASGKDDVVNQLNVFGWALCGSEAGMNAAIIKNMGLHPRTLSIANGGHTFWEVQYADSSWHALDTMTTFYVYNRQTPRRLVSVADIKADHSLALNAEAEGRACPGFLLCGDTASYFATGSDTWKLKSDPGDTATTKSMNMDIRMGEAVSRTWESWANEYYKYPTNTPPYHHEANRDWKDYVNLPYWEPYQVSSDESTALGISMMPTYRRWANGTIVLAPDFRSAGYQASLESGTNLATFNDDGLTPDLHVATVGTLATAVFKIATPFYMTDAYIDATFFRDSPADINRLYVSPDGTAWTKVWENTSTGTSQLNDINARTQVFGKYQMWVKVELQATAAKTDAGLSNLVIRPVFEHNKGGMAYLDKGVNHITVTLDNPQDLATGAAFKVTYKWKEYDGSGWNVARTHEQYVTASPFTYTITTAGDRVPRTESIIMEVTEPPMPDGSAPAPIDDLALTLIDSTKVGLTWTATGDDWDSGQATSYDLRYSTSPITSANFDAATQVSDAPAPQIAGTTESFVVTGLLPSTTYYFAIKAKDEGGNTSDLSNVVSPLTLPPDVVGPAAVDNLKGSPSKTGHAVDLSWTATGDDGLVGTATSYDLRYSTSPINDGNFASATQVTGEPAPNVAGSTESFAVTGLTVGTQYYFALKAIDDAGNISEISNIAATDASNLGEKVLQDGLNGYTGCKDNYIYVNSPTTNNGTRSLMRVTGYTTDLQRPLVRFDLSSIPAGVSVTRATLWLYSNNPPQVKGSTGFYGAYKLTKDWGETTSTWNTPWTTPGGDFLATPDAEAAKQSAAAAPCWYAFDVTARVQAWIEAPSDNYGWLIKCTNELLSNQDEFASSDSPDPAFFPKLIISDLPEADTTAPAAVADLAGADLGDGSIQLTWTATGDDGSTGTAWQYDVRYTTDAQSPVSEANWDSLAQAVTGLPLPKSAGSTESFVVTGLSANHTYHFAMKVIDETGNTSGLSNGTDVSLAQGPRTVVLEASKDGPMYGLVAGGNTNRGLGGRFDLAVDGTADVNGVLMQFDLTGLLTAGERIDIATLDLYCVRGQAGNVWNLDLRAYPLLAPWVEGTGTTDGVVGSTDSPWGPAAIGDAVYNYRQVTAIAPLSTWGNYDGAAAGVPWAVPGARGVGTDVSSDLLISQNVSGVGHVLGQKLCSLSFTATGVDVLNKWARGRQANYGLSLFPLSSGGTGFIAAGTREHATADWRPKLTLRIVPGLIGDINKDNYVNVGDLQLLVACLGQR